MIGGDSESLRTLAARVREASAEIDHAARDVRSVESVEWRSSAADRFRETLEQRAAEFRDVVGRYDALAGSLDHLATTLDSRQAFLQQAFDDARDAFEAAQDGVEDAVDAGVDRAWDYAGDIAGFARDHLGWLR